MSESSESEVEVTVTSRPRRCFADTKEKAKIQQKVAANREQQMIAAVEYCKKHQCRGYTAIRNNICPLIKDPRTINARLDHQKKVSRQSRSDSKILTEEEEQQLVRFMRNKNKAAQGISRKEVTKFIYDFLVIRSKVNKENRDRRYVPLSKPARTFMLTKTLSRSFWRRLEAKHPVLTRKRQGNASVCRAAACSRETAIEHIDDLARECIACNIFTNAEQQEPGVWTGDVDLSRIENHDEMPQFINFGVDGRAHSLVYAHSSL